MLRERERKKLSDSQLKITPPLLLINTKKNIIKIKMRKIKYYKNIITIWF